MTEHTLTVGDQLLIGGTRLAVLDITADEVVFGIVEDEDAQVACLAEESVLQFDLCCK